VNNNYSPVIFLNLLSWEFFTGIKKVKSNPSIKNILVRTVKRMSQEKKIIATEHTSVRVALWREFSMFRLIQSPSYLLTNYLPMEG
jgi:hypothetical protein